MRKINAFFILPLDIPISFLREVLNPIQVQFIDIEQLDGSDMCKDLCRHVSYLTSIIYWKDFEYLYRIKKPKLYLPASLLGEILDRYKWYQSQHNPWPI